MQPTILYRDPVLILLDQTRLPLESVSFEAHTLAQVCDAIRRLVVRGAPAIGIAAAYGLVVGLDERVEADGAAPPREVYDAVEAALAATRPTAVNLFWALAQMRDVYVAHDQASWPTLRARLLARAIRLHEDDIAQNRALGRYGAALLEDGWGVLTHCNAGALATGGYGTALGVIRAAHEAGKRLHIWVDETRPLLQGARLTAYELHEDGIPLTLICDNMAASLMRSGRVQAVIVGADRVAANGDAANKIGTYGVALAARYHQIPFYVAFPSSTFDPELADGASIPIEQRDPEEVRRVGTYRSAAENIPVWNPAFDVTPHELITAWITEKGVIAPPFTELRG